MAGLSKLIIVGLSFQLLIPQTCGSYQLYQRTTIRSQKGAGEDINLISTSGYRLRARDLINTNRLMIFFRSDCPACQRTIFRWYSYIDIQADSLIVLFISPEPIEKLQQFKALFEINFDLYHDENMNLTRTFGVKTVPYVVVVEQDGTLAYKGQSLPDEATLFDRYVLRKINHKREILLGGEGVVFQREANECGIAVLKMLLDRLRMSNSYDELRESINSRDGISLLEMKKYLEGRGLKAEGWRLTFDDLKKQPLPCILFINHHFVLLTKFVRDFTIVIDPARGRYLWAKERLLDLWKGETLIVKQIGFKHKV